MFKTSKAIIVDKYTDLRTALDATEFWNNGKGERFSVDTENWADASNPLAIRALLTERDALREALEIARDFVAEALAQERDAYRGYEAVSDIADIERCLAQIDAAMEKQP